MTEDNETGEAGEEIEKHPMERTGADSLPIQLRGTAEALEDGTITKREAIQHLIMVLADEDGVLYRSEGAASQGRVSFGRPMEDVDGLALFYPEDPDQEDD